MVNVERFVMRRFDENAYVLYDETGDCVLVDCGCIEKEEYGQIVSFIETNELKVTRLICTHFHIDHITHLLPQNSIVLFLRRCASVVTMFYTPLKPSTHRRTSSR